MNQLQVYLFITSLGVLSLLATYIIKQLAIRHHLVHIPNERSLHNVATPRIGGLAIVLTWYIGITVLFCINAIEKNLYFALMSGILLAVVSFLDDLTNIKPFIRLIIQFSSTTLAFIFLNGLRPLVIPSIEFNYSFIVYPLAVIGMVWFINLFNFMDGVDGFASIEAIIISIVLFVYSGNAVNALLISCVSGFLVWNWPKAKIFMGDIGSTQLGFILVVLGIYFHNQYQFSILNWIMLSSPFWFDATYTLFRRWKNKEKLSKAHRKHVYQRAVQAGFSHQRVLLFLILINALIFLMILLYREFKVLQIPLFILSLTLYYYITKQVDKKVPFK